MVGSSPRLESKAKRVLAQVCLLEKEGHLSEASELLKPLLSADPGDPEASYRMAHICLAQDALDEAESWLRRTLELRHDDARAYTNLGVVLDLRGHCEEAIRAFRRAIHLDPNQAVAYLNLGALYGEMGRYEDAVRFLQQCLRLFPSFDALFNLATVRFQQGELDEAEQLFERALEANAGHALTFYYLGLCRTKRGLLDAAAEAFESALKSDGDLLRARHHLGKTYRRIGRGHDAVRELKKVAHALPDDPQILRELGLAYDATECRTESLKCFRQARMLDAHRR